MAWQQLLPGSWILSGARSRPLINQYKSSGDHVPLAHLLAYIAGAWLVAAGMAILWQRTERIGAAGSAIIYLVFALLWVPRFYTVHAYVRPSHRCLALRPVWHRSAAAAGVTGDHCLCGLCIVRSSMARASRCSRSMDLGIRSNPLWIGAPHQSSRHGALCAPLGAVSGFLGSGCRHCFPACWAWRLFRGFKTSWRRDFSP